jgi:hypothetical protein
MKVYYWSWAIFTSFVVLTSFILYSLIIAVVCDAVKVTEHQDEDAADVREKEDVRERLFLMEHHVGDMAEQQLAIVENLRIAIAALVALDDTSQAEGANNADMIVSEDSDIESESDSHSDGTLSKA